MCERHSLPGVSRRECFKERGPVLGWLDTVGNGMLDGRSISTIRANNRLANDLSRLDFKKGNYAMAISKIGVRPA